MPNVADGSGTLSGVPSVYCSDPKPLGAYTPCTSAFFATPAGASYRYRSLDKAAVHRIITAANVVALLEALVQEREAAAERSTAREAQMKAIEYRSAFAAATQPDGIRAFVRKYGSDDPDGLIPQARARLADLERGAFATAKSRGELQAFINAYGRDDPADLVPQARRRLVAAGERDRARDEFDSLPRRIASCKALIRAAELTIARERRIEAVSGTVSLATLHRAGEQLVYCRDAIPQWYASYRRHGGQRALEAIR
jgi:hypothetical protein